MNPVTSLNITALMNTSIDSTVWPANAGPGGRSAFDLVFSDVMEGIESPSTVTSVESVAKSTGTVTGLVIASGSKVRSVTPTAMSSAAVSTQAAGSPIPIRVYHAELLAGSDVGSESAIPVILLVAANGQAGKDGTDTLMISSPGQDVRIARLMDTGDKVAVHMIGEIITDSDLQAMFAAFMPRNNTDVPGLTVSDADQSTVGNVIAYSHKSESLVQTGNSNAPQSPLQILISETLADDGQTVVSSRDTARTTLEAVPVRLALPEDTDTSLTMILPVITDAGHTGSSSDTTEGYEVNQQIKISLFAPESVQTPPAIGAAEPVTGQKTALPLTVNVAGYIPETMSGIRMESGATQSTIDNIRLFTYMHPDGTVEIMIDRQSASALIDTNHDVTEVEPVIADNTVSFENNRPAQAVSSEPVAEVSAAITRNALTSAILPTGKSADRSIVMHTVAQVSTQDTTLPSSHVLETIHDDMAAFVEQPPEYAAAVETGTDIQPTDNVTTTDESLLTTPRAIEGNNEDSERRISVTVHSPRSTDHQVTEVSRYVRGGELNGQSHPISAGMLNETVITDTPDTMVNPTVQTDQTIPLHVLTDQPTQVETGDERNVSVAHYGADRIIPSPAPSHPAESKLTTSESPQSGTSLTDAPPVVSQSSGMPAQPLNESDTVIHYATTQSNNVVVANKTPDILNPASSVPGRVPASMTESVAPEIANGNAQLPTVNATQIDRNMPPAGIQAEDVPAAVAVTESAPEPLVVDTGKYVDQSPQVVSGEEQVLPAILHVDRAVALTADDGDHNVSVRLDRPIPAAIESETPVSVQVTDNPTYTRIGFTRDGSDMISSPPQSVSAEASIPTQSSTGTLDDVPIGTANLQITNADREVAPRATLKERRIGHARAAVPTLTAEQEQEAHISVVSRSLSIDNITSPVSGISEDLAAGNGHHALDDTYTLPDSNMDGTTKSDQSTTFGIELTETREAATVHKFSIPASGRDTTDPERVTQAIVRHARIMIRQGESSARIQLEPPHLGKLQLDIVTENSKVTGRITVESAEVRDIVQNNMPLLRESLTQSGLKVESFDVQVGHNGGTDSWARMETARQQARYRTNNRENYIKDSTSPEPASVVAMDVRRGSPGYSTTFDRWI